MSQSPSRERSQSPKGEPEASTAADLHTARVVAHAQGRCPGIPLDGGGYSGCRGGADCPVCEGQSFANHPSPRGTHRLSTAELAGLRARLDGQGVILAGWSGRLLATVEELEVELASERVRYEHLRASLHKKPAPTDTPEETRAIVERVVDWVHQEAQRIGEQLAAARVAEAQATAALAGRQAEQLRAQLDELRQAGRELVACLPDVALVCGECNRPATRAWLTIFGAVRCACDEHALEGASDMQNAAPLRRLRELLDQEGT